MSGVVRLTLPWDVLAQVNHRLTSRGRGPGLTLSADYRAKKHAAEVLVQAQVRGERPRFTGPVSMTLRFYEPDRRRRDPSNLLKLVEDAMSGTVYDDDHRIHRQTWERAGVDRERPRVEIVVEALDVERAA